MCWLYSVPNFLVILHVEALYLGGNNVRVMCERVRRKLKFCAFKGVSRLDLAIAKLPKYHMCEACKKLKGHDSCSTTGQKVQSALAINSRLKLAIHSNREAKSPKCPVLLKTNFSHSISYPTINTLIPMKCKGLRKRSLLREKS